MILLVFAFVVISVIVVFLLVMQVQSKLERMTGGTVSTAHYSFSMTPLPPTKEVLPTLEPLTPEEVAVVAKQMAAVQSSEQVVPKGIQSACFIHIFDDEDQEELARTLYSLTQYITTPFSSGTPQLLGDIVVINITTQADYVVPMMQRLLLLNNKKYMRLFFICRDHLSKPLPTLKPYANGITSFHLPFITYAPITQKKDTDPINSIYYGPAHIFNTPPIYIEPNDENVICLRYSTSSLATSQP